MHLCCPLKAKFFSMASGTSVDAYTSALTSIAVFAAALVVTDLILLRKARAKITLLDVLTIALMVALISAVIMGSVLLAYG